LLLHGHCSFDKKRNSGDPLAGIAAWKTRGRTVHKLLLQRTKQGQGLLDLRGLVFALELCEKQVSGTSHGSRELHGLALAVPLALGQINAWEASGKNP
jgi:hypothetical protein